MNKEDKRQWVHLSVVGFALLIPWLNKWQAILLGIVAVIFNLWILPKIAPALFREIERVNKLIKGIVAYPLTVLIIVLICPWQMKELAAAAWAILAFGDSFSNLVGRKILSPKLPWNKQKSVAGLVGFWIFGMIGSLFFLWWVNPTIGIIKMVQISGITVLLTGFIETLDIGIDDNFTVGISAIILLLLMYKFI